MGKQILPTPEQLRKLLRYEPETGKLFWRPRDVSYFNYTGSPSRQLAAWNTRFLNKEAFTCTNSAGYKASVVMGVGLLAHRVAWAIYYGAWPSNVIDHINGITSDNRISNLRDCEHYENSRNARIRLTNKSGLKGVSWDRESGKWRAQIFSDGKKKNLGRFDDPFDAHHAYCTAAKKHRGEFARSR